MKDQPITVSNIVEIPEALDLSIQSYLGDHPKWSRERLDQAAYSLFLMQNGSDQPHVIQLYLDSLFGNEA